jgi:hypothetical protein
VMGTQQSGTRVSVMSIHTCADPVACSSAHKAALLRGLRGTANVVPAGHRTAPASHWSLTGAPPGPVASDHCPRTPCTRRDK